MYDDLMEKDPKMQQIRAKMRDQGLAEGIAKGRAEGEAKGEAKGRRKELQKVILVFVQKRFPSLIEQAQRKVSRVMSADELSKLYLELIGVNDESAAQQLFTS